jgi:hypothetical protein
VSDLRARWDKFNTMVDAEQIIPFQKYVYYPLITVFSLYLAFFADGKPQGVDESLGNTAYICWLALGSACPTISLFGRYLFDSSIKRAPDEPNSAYGGSSLMLTGDAGVWASIIIYLYCTIGAAWWGDPMWGLAFVLMGVPGGGIFTYRSWRRRREIHRRIRRNRRLS